MSRLEEFCEDASSKLSVEPRTEDLTAATDAYPFSRRAHLATGQPIGKLMAQALKFPDLVSLAAGFVDNATLPCEATQRCFRELCLNTDVLRRALQYNSTAGSTELREFIAQWSYHDWPDAAPHADRIVLTAGSNQFLHLLAEAIIDPGDIVITAAPTYFVFVGTLKGVDARVIGVQADEDGICIDALQSQLESLAAAGQAHRVKAIYTVTEFDNPAGSTLSLERRERLLEIVAAWRRLHGPLLVLSDNAYQLLRYEGESLPPLTAIDPACGEFVIELGTFSKSFSPGIRVGWGVVPTNMVNGLLELKSNMDFGSPHFSQVLLHEVLKSGELDKHLPGIRQGYREKRNAMLQALDAELGDVPGVSWRHPQGGLYVWLTLPEEIDASESGELWRQATQSGVLYVPGHYCFPTEGCPVQRNTIRLSFGVQSSSGIQEGIHRLATAIRSVDAMKNVNQIDSRLRV